MSSSTLTSKGQITVPQEVREDLSLQAGDRIDFVRDEAGRYQFIPRRTDIKTLRGCFAGRVRRPVSIEEMNDAISEEAAQSYRRITRNSPVKSRNSK